LAFGVTGAGIPDATLSATFGNEPLPRERTLGKQRVDAFDGSLANPALAKVLEDVAADVGVDPGLLAVTALHEVWGGAQYLLPGTLSKTIGVDRWELERGDLHKTVPASRAIKDEWTPEIYYNERLEKTAHVYRFATGKDAALAVASDLKSRELQLVAEVGKDQWNGIPIGERFAIIRYSYNVGLGAAGGLAVKAASGHSVLVPSGPVFINDKGDFHPLRHATQTAGQAIHISQTIYGNVYPSSTALALPM
jgi:hypothetical protein